MSNRALLAKIEELSEKLQKNKEPSKTDATLTDANLLAKHDALIEGFPANPDNQRPQALQAKFDELLQKATRRIAYSPSKGENTVSLTAYAEQNNRETPDYMQEIRRMEDKLEELYHRLDHQPEEQQVQSLLSKFEELLARSSRKFDESQSRGVNTASIAAFSEADKRETPEVLKETRRMEKGFTERLENLYQRVDNRINRLARRNRTMCYRCRTHWTYPI